MSHKLIISVLLLIISNQLFAQTDKSKTILDKSSSVLNSYKTISSDFTYTSTEAQTNETASGSGKILIKNDKYRLSLKDSEIYFDGKNVYNYITKSNEVNISYPESSKTEKGEFFISNPRDLFKFQTKNFKSKFISDKIVKNKECYEIDLYPVNLKTIYSRIKLHIEKSTYHILDITVFQKDGFQESIEFTGFKVNPEINDSEFTFDPKKYPGIIVNDMRF